MRIGLFVPCFVDALCPRAGIATVRLLERLGHEVRFAAGAVCCGQPAFNAGHWDLARPVAETCIAALDAVEADAIVCPSGSCAAFLRSHLAELLPDDPRAAAVAAKTFELGELLARRLALTDVGARFPARVVWHDACHALRALGLHDEPRRLLAAVRGLELVEAPGGAECCGFGGVFAVTHADVSTAIGEERAAALERTGADVIASSDPTCLMQLAGLLARRGWRGRALHLAEILAET